MANNYEDFWIPCPHEDSDCRAGNELPNYHPLTAEQVTDLYELARSSNMFRYAQAVMRLCQGIEGMVCPYRIEGPVADMQIWVEHFMAEAADPGVNVAPLPVLIRVLAVPETREALRV